MAKSGDNQRLNSGRWGAGAPQDGDGVARHDGAVHEAPGGGGLTSGPTDKGPRRQRVRRFARIALVVVLTYILAASNVLAPLGMALARAYATGTPLLSASEPTAEPAQEAATNEADEEKAAPESEDAASSADESADSNEGAGDEPSADPGAANENAGTTDKADKPAPDTTGDAADNANDESGKNGSGGQVKRR